MPTSQNQRVKLRTAVAPRSGARGWRMFSWLLLVVVAVMMVLIDRGAAFAPGDNSLRNLCVVLVMMFPPVGAVCGVLALWLSRTVPGRIFAVLPAVAHAVLWVWLIAKWFQSS